MSFFCQTCCSKILRTITVEEPEGKGLVAIVCGHLFHRKCLDVSITNQKLQHATYGQGPFRPSCPVPDCGNAIGDNGIIALSNSNPTSSHKDEEEDDVELQLIKRVQGLVAEKERMQLVLNKLETENEGLKETVDEIKFECEDVSSFLLNDGSLKRGDRVFWVTKERTFAPGHIVEMRKTSKIDSYSSNYPIAIVKLDNKITLPAIGAERDTVIVPVTEILTFKAFFSDSFTDFRHKLWKILDKGKQMSTGEGQQTIRRNFRDSSTRLPRDRLSSTLSGPYETIDAIPFRDLPSLGHQLNTGEQRSLRRSPAKMLRAKSMSFGTFARSPDSESTGKSSRSSTRLHFSGNSSPSILTQSSNGTTERSSISASSNDGDSRIVQNEGTTDNNYITVGERVIYYDEITKDPRVGEVASVLKYTPCAIVKFDEFPDQPEVLTYRTVPLSQLFPHALSSPEEKLKIAEAYGKVYEFLEEHMHLFEEEGDEEDELDVFGQQQSLSSSSSEELFATIHEV